ncbi:MAG: hypothetical protein R3B70_25835 [Polyangiaceae bacterium]
MCRRCCGASCGAGTRRTRSGGACGTCCWGGGPKDFDVATSARPEEVRELFRNSRIIGRRFRLVHVLFQGGKVIEVATFRKNPNQKKGKTGASSGATTCSARRTRTRCGAISR